MSGHGTMKTERVIDLVERRGNTSPPTAISETLLEHSREAG